MASCFSLYTYNVLAILRCPLLLYHALYERALANSLTLSLSHTHTSTSMYYMYLNRNRNINNHSIMQLRIVHIVSSAHFLPYNMQMIYLFTAHKMFRHYLYFWLLCYHTVSVCVCVRVCMFHRNYKICLCSFDLLWFFSRWCVPIETSNFRARTSTCNPHAQIYPISIFTQTQFSGYMDQ